MNYKKIIRNQQLRFRILRALSWIPDSLMLRLQYRIKMGFWPNFCNPKRFTEKLQLYKMKYRNPVMHQCVDKYEVRSYVESKGLGNILNELYGVYDHPDDIDFDNLPNQFVMKTTTGGGGQNVIIVKDKTKENLDLLRSKMTLWSSENNLGALSGREWAYNKCKSRIIVEKLLADDLTGNLSDYKMMFFNGKFRSLWVDRDRYTNHRRGFWDEHLNFLADVSSDHDTFDNAPSLPSNIKEMIEVGKKLSEDFPYARIDLYNIQGKIVFGEVTFYPWSGYVKFCPDEFDFRLRSYFTEY